MLLQTCIWQEIRSYGLFVCILTTAALCTVDCHALNKHTYGDRYYTFNTSVARCRLFFVPGIAIDACVSLTGNTRTTSSCTMDAESGPSVIQSMMSSHNRSIVVLIFSPSHDTTICCEAKSDMTGRRSVGTGSFKWVAALIKTGNFLFSMPLALSVCLLLLPPQNTDSL